MKTRMDRLFERIESNGLESLTLSERSAFAIVWLFRETNNGGLDQFFFNDAGKLAPDALRGLVLFGAPATANILRQAISIFPESEVPFDLKQRRDFLCDSMTDEHKELLDKLTTEFFESPEPVSDMVQSYIENHPDEFPT